MIQSEVLVYLLEEAHNRVSAIQSQGKSWRGEGANQVSPSGTIELGSHA